MIAEGIYIIFSLILAYINKRLIAYDKPIYHGWNGFAHAVFWGVVLLITKSWFPLITLPFLGRLFFDAGLNVMRGLPISYVARRPKSIIDRWEKKIFDNDGILPKLIYLIIIIGLNIIFYA